MGRLMARGKNWCAWRRQEKTFPLLLGPNWPKGGFGGRECRSGLGRVQSRLNLRFCGQHEKIILHLDWPRLCFLRRTVSILKEGVFFSIIALYFMTDSEERKLNIKGCHSCQYMSIHMFEQGDPVRTKVPCLLVTGYSLNKGQIIYHLSGGPRHSISSSRCFNQSKLHWLFVYTKIYENFCCVPNCTLLLLKQCTVLQ